MDYSPRIKVGESNCYSVSFVSQSSLVCTTPRGTGALHAVSATVTGQVTAVPSRCTMCVNGTRNGLPCFIDDDCNANGYGACLAAGKPCVSALPQPPEFLMCADNSSKLCTSGDDCTSHKCSTCNSSYCWPVHAFCYDSPKTDSLVPNHGSTTGRFSLTIVGANFDLTNHSADAQFGDTPSMMTYYVSDTTVMGMVAPGAGRNLEVRLTILGYDQEFVERFSYLAPIVNSTTQTNSPSTGLAQIAAFGREFAIYDYSVRSRLGSTACEGSVWISYSSVLARCDNHRGLSTSQQVLITVALQQGTLPMAITFDSHLVSSASPKNAPATGRTALLVTGSALGTYSMSPETSVGGTANERTRWSSDTAVSARIHHGIDRSYAIAITVSTRFSTGSDLVSFDIIQLYRSQGNAPILQAPVLTSIGSNFGKAAYSAVSRVSKVSGNVTEQDQACERTEWYSDSSLGIRPPWGDVADSFGGRSIVATLYRRSATVSEAVTYNSGVVSGIRRTDTPANATWVNGPSTGGSSVQIFGVSWGVYDYSLHARLGLTTCEATAWISNSVVQCLVPSGIRINKDVAITIHVGLGVDAMSSVFSYDRHSFFAIEQSNGAKAGALVLDVTVSGKDFTSSDQSMVSRIGRTSTLATIWVSDSSLVVKAAAGVHPYQGLVVTTDRVKSTVSSLFTYHSPGISSVGIGSGCLNCDMVTMVGNNMATYSASAQARLGGLSCESTGWASDTVVDCRFASDPGGLWKPLDNGAVVTISSRLGSLTKMITYQSPYVSSLGVTNAVTAGAYSLTIYGSRFGSGLSMLTGLELGSADFSPLARIGLTACENTRWISDTSLHVQHPNGVSSSLEVVASLGAKMYTSMPVFTFNSAVVTDIASQNANQNTSAHMTIHGMSFGFSDYSARAILGTATEVTVWSSDTALSAVPAAGVFADVAVIVSVGAHVLDGLGFAGCNICYQYNALTNAWSYDSVVLDDLAPPNGGSSGGFALTILGQQFGLTDFSPETRLGGTACEFSQWMSSSAVLCSSPPGENNQRVAAVTIYSRFSTRTKSFTYDELYISAVHPRNGPKSGDTTILVIGQNLKVTDSSPLARLHETACKASAWVSDSVITCLISAGNCIDRDVVATVGAVQHTVYSSFSHDTPMVSALKATTNGASNVAVISVLGSNFAATAVSASVRIGGTPTVSIRWTSDSSIVAGVPNGARVLHAIVITVGCNATNSTDAMGTLSNAFSYDAPVIAAAVIVNASNLDDQTLASNLAGSSTPYFLMTGRSFSWVSYSLSARISGTSAEHTEWYSDSSAVGRAPTPAYSTLADGSVAITVGGLGKLTQVYTFDGPQLSALSQFVDCTSCDMLTLAGAEFKSVDSSVQARLRGLPCQASVWTSDSSVSCKVPGNSLGLSVASDSGAVITVQGQLASLTKSLTYTQPTIASANISTVNSPATGKTSITVVGSRFGSGLSFLYGLEVGAVDSSVQIRAGGTACESTDWISDSSLSAKMAAGFDQQIGLVVSVGSTKQSGLQVMTYDAAAVSAVAQITNCTSCNSLTLLGTSFAEVDTTPKARLGGLPCQAAQWASDSSVHCRIAANSLTLSNSSDSGVVITVLGRLGSITKTLDYSLPNITSVHDTNSPLSGKVSITVSGAQFGAGLSFLLGIEVGIADWSLATRVGGSACESTDWISDSSLHVKLAQGFGSEHAIVVSLVKLYVSGRQALTYSAPQVVAGSAMSLNFGLGNVVNVTFSGDSFGNFAVSLTTRQGMTAAEQTSWLSSTSLTAHIPAGFRGTLQSIVTTGAAFGSITDAISYDHVPIRGPSANISHPSANFPSHPAQSIIVTALNLSPFERSVRLRVSFSAMESTLWLSDTCTQGRHPVGVASTRTTVLTAGLQSGSITDVVSYDSTLIRNFNGTSNVPANSAQVVTVHGRNLMLSDESHATRFGNTACESSDWLSDTSLYCKTTVGLFGSQKTSVTAGASVSTATMLGTYDNAGIVYVKASTQEIAQNIPPVPQNQSISLAGYNFGGYDVCSALRSGSTANPATFWTSDTAVAARVALGMGTLSGVFTAGRKAGSISSVFTFDAPLTSSLKPGNAMASGLGTITMAGDNFLLNDLTGAGRIGGTSCQATEWTSSTSLKCRLSPGIHPQLGLLATAGSPGLAAGSLTLAFSYSAPSTSGSTVVNAPSLGGGTITLHGSSFGAFDYSQRIRIGGTACTASQWQLDGAVVCKTPGGSGLNRQVVMTTGGQIGTLTGLFTFNLPSVNQIFPGNLPTTGGTTLTMVGGEFGNADVAQVIKVGGTPCLTTVYFSDSSLHCLSPAGVGSIPTLEVFSAGLSGIGRNLLSYDTPSISAISPSNDAVSGGRTISIFGAGFGTAPYVFTNYTAQGSINGTLTNVTGFHSDSSIMMSAPAGIGKSLPALVTVATQVGQITGAFSYDLPVVTDFYPRNSPTKGGITVTVNGFNLGDNRRHVHTARLLSGHYSGTMVNDYEGTVIGTPSFTTLVMVIGVGAGVNKSLQVTVAEQSGQSLLPVAFNFDAPNITLVFPNFGGTLGGDTLSVIGNNFGPGLPPNGGPVVISYHDAAGFPGECASISEGADPHTLLHCVTNRGAGQGFNLTVNIDTQVATSLAAFSYAAPIVVAMTPNFSPAAGGGTVTLFGSNFGIMDYQTSGQIGITLCPSVTWFADSQVRCIVPAGIGGGLSVAVGSDGQYGSRADLFSYSAPKLNSVFPTSGPTSGGIDVTVSGVNFGTSSIYQSNLSASVGGRASSQATFVSDTSMVIGIPVGGGSQVVQVFVAGQPSDLVVPFHYNPPIVTAVTPRNGLTLGGTLLRVFGSNFGPVDTSPFVSLGLATGTYCTNNIWTSDTAMTTVSPPGKSFPHDVFVSIPGFAVSTGSLIGGWSYDVPTLTAISPGNAPTSGAVSVTILGKNLVAPPTLTIGNTASTSVTIVSDTAITLVAPAGVGVGHAITGTFDGDPSFGSLEFTYDAPVITHIDPRNGPTNGGDFVTIRGKNFGKSSEIGQVSASIGNTACTSVGAVTDHVAVKCETSGGYGIALAVQVTVASQLSNVDQVFSYDIPVITAVAPNVAETVTSTTVTILGRNFGDSSAGRSARIGNTLCSTVSFISFSALGCTVEPGLGAQLDVLVQVDIVSGSTANIFSYYAPQLASLQRANGPPTGGTTTTVSGSHFGIYDSNVVAQIDARACSPKLWTSDSSILCGVPANIGKDKTFSLGVVGQSVSSFQGFSYNAPILTSITPATSPTSGATSSPVTLHGFNFGASDPASAASAKIGSTFSPTVTWLSDNQIRATVPDGEGIAHSSYITIAGQSSLLAAAFSYEPPSITALIYTTSDTDGGNTITVLGTNFGSTAAVQSATIGSTAAGVTYNSHIVTLLTTPPGTGKALRVSMDISGQPGNYSSCGRPECAFSYTAPSITHVTPKYGAAAGGTQVTLYGSNFGQGLAAETGASIHGLSCASATWVSSTSMTCASAPNAFISNRTLACVECNAHSVTAQVIINELVGTLPNAFSYTNDGSNAGSAALWCSAAKVAFASNTDGMLYIDPDGTYTAFATTALRKSFA